MPLKRFYIHHVESTGNDLRFEEQPSFPPCLTVDLIGSEVEQTYTKTVETMEGPWNVEIQPRPKGLGWALHQEFNGHTVWRRPHDENAHTDRRNWRVEDANKTEM